MSKRIMSVFMCMFVFSTAAVAKPWYVDLFKSDSEISDSKTIGYLAGLTEDFYLYEEDREYDRDLIFRNYKSVIPRLLKSNLTNEEVLEDILIAMYNSRFSIVYVEKYLMNIIEHKSAGPKTYENVLNFLRSYKRLVLDNHLIIEKIISKTNNLQSDLLVKTVDIILTSRRPRVKDAESLILKIINKVKTDYIGLCFILHALQEDYAEEGIKTNPEVDKNKLINLTVKQMGLIGVPEGEMACPEVSF